MTSLTRSKARLLKEEEEEAEREEKRRDVIVEILKIKKQQ